MANDHPFQTLFETLGRIPSSHAESVNLQAYEILCDFLNVSVEKTGRCILLRAPRAGHGKTHLLSRIQHQLGATHEFIPLHPAFGCRIDAASVTDDALRRFVRPLPASGGLCMLDLITRRLFAMALQPLVTSGEVPCQDREGALAALRNRPIETFDFHHSNAVTAHWARENFEVLGQRLSMELALRCSLPVREVAFWVNALFRFASTPLDNAGRIRALAEDVRSGNPADGETVERLEALLGMVSLLMRVVLVADDLEGFSADETAALRLAAFLGSLRQSVERLDVILSLNLDIWESAFLPRLSDGLADRLSEVVIELDPLTEDQMIALLESRVPGLGREVFSRIDVNTAGTHARGLVRAAGMAWLNAMATNSSASKNPTETVVPSAVPSVAEVTESKPRIDASAESPFPVASDARVAAAPPARQDLPPVFAEPAKVAPSVTRETIPPVFATEAPAKEPVTKAVETPSRHLQGPEEVVLPFAAVPTPWPSPRFTPVEEENGVEESVVRLEPDSPFKFPPTQSVSRGAPVAASSVPPNWQVPAPAFSAQVPAPEPPSQSPAEPSPFQQSVSDSPFQVAPRETSPTTVVTPEIPDSPSQQNLVDLTFQPSQDFNPPPVQPALTPEPTPVFPPEIESPFQVPPAAEVPAVQSQNYSPQAAAHSLESQQIPQPVVQAPELEPTPAQAPDTDRVDELLRQFRERYGRGSL